LTEGFFDLHVHSSPCLYPRLASDPEVVDLCEVAGFAGCVLKSHYEPTAGRAALAGAGRRIRVYGGLVLNAAPGGFNPFAVEIALGMGARIIWMPTVDAMTAAPVGVPSPAGSGAHPKGYAAPPVDRTTARNLRQIFALIADADAVLATGHLSTPEVGWVTGEARRAGVRRVLLTHPTFTVPGMTFPEAAELVQAGAFAEITAWQLFHQSGFDGPRLAAFVREIGYERCVLSSDAGMVDMPPPPEALARLVDELVGAGLDRRAVESCASQVPEALVSL
jgi:hypothetical protein